MSTSVATTEKTQESPNSVEDKEEENDEVSKEEKKEDEKTKALRVYLAKELNLAISPNRIKKALNARHILRMSDGSEVAYARYLLEVLVQLIIHTYNHTRETTLSGPHIMSAAKCFTPLAFLDPTKMCIPIQSVGNQKEDVEVYIPMYTYPFKQTLHQNDEYVYERYYTKLEQIEALYKKSVPNSKNSSFSKFNLSFDSVMSSKGRKKINMFFPDTRFTTKKALQDKKPKVSSEKPEKSKKKSKQEPSQTEEEGEELTKKKRKRDEPVGDSSKKKEDEQPKKKAKVDKPRV